LTWAGRRWKLGVMIETADVVVIGGGVAGTSIACALAERGAQVTLCERAGVASGASGRSSALVRMHYTNEWDARLAWASFPVFRDWSERMGGPSVFTRTGFLNLVAPAYAENLRGNVLMLQRIGVDTVALSPGEVPGVQAGLELDDVGAAAYEPESGYASPVEVVEGFRRRAARLGARILEWTPVTRLRAGASRVTGVDTPGGRIDAGAVVVAAGAWAMRLCHSVGLDLPARPKGIDTALVTRPPDLAPHVTVIDNVLGSYFRAEGGGLTLVGVPCHDWDVDPGELAGRAVGLPPGAAEIGAGILVHRLPAMARATLARGYRAFDAYSDDRHAILGKVDGLDGLYLATAFSGSGFKIAPAVGVCLAELILDGEARTVDIRPFGLDRFAEGRVLEGPYPYGPRPDHAAPLASPSRP
jgi:glycine/D-amino acid oxidase-like deaminating enzyme